MKNPSNKWSMNTNHKQKYHEQESLKNKYQWHTITFIVKKMCETCVRENKSYKTKWGKKIDLNGI